MKKLLPWLHFIICIVFTQSLALGQTTAHENLVKKDTSKGTIIITYAQPLRIDQEIEVLVGKRRTKKTNGYRLVKVVEISFPDPLAPLGQIKEIGVEYFSFSGKKINPDKIKPKAVTAE